MAYLKEQNELIETAAELERETSSRVSVLGKKLQDTAQITRDYMLKLCEYEQQAHSMILHRFQAENRAVELEKRSDRLEADNLQLRQQVTSLRQDTNSLLTMIARARDSGFWELDDLRFTSLNPADVLQAVTPSDSSNASSDYRVKTPSDPFERRKVLEKDLEMSRLRSDLRLAERAKDELQLEVLERDRAIANLELEIGEVNNRLTFQELELDSFPSSCAFKKMPNYDDALGFGAINREHVSKNRAVDVACQTEEDSELKQMKIQNVKLTERLHHLQQKVSEVQSVLSNEVADRHDDIARLKLELEEEAEKLQEAQSQTILKAQVILDLRSDLKAANATIAKLRRDTKEKEVTFQAPSESSEGVQSDSTIRTEDASNELDDRVPKLQNELLEKSTLVTQLQMHIQSLSIELEAKGKTTKTLEAELSESCQRIGELSDLLRTTEAHRDSLQKNSELKDQMLNELNKNLQTYTKERDKILTDLSEKEDMICRLNSGLTTAQSEISQQRTTISNLQSAMERSLRQDGARGHVGCDCEVKVMPSDINGNGKTKLASPKKRRESWRI